MSGDRLVELFKKENAGARRPGGAVLKEARINKAEFRSALLRLGMHATYAELDALFDAMDTDGNGTLSQSEVRAQLMAGASGLLVNPYRSKGGAGAVGSARRPGAAGSRTPKTRALTGSWWTSPRS